MDWNAHFGYGKDQAYPGNNFEYHIIPFEGAFEANTAQIMPYYGIPVGQTNEEVAFGYNKQVLTDILRKQYGFEGVICADWGIISDVYIFGFQFMEGRAWGVESLTLKERLLKALDAGIDQFGGEKIPELIVELVEEGKLSEKRIDASLRRILRDKFRLGLFENPYVDVEQAPKIVGRSDFKQKGKEAQRKSIVLLKNELGQLPLSVRTKIYVENMSKEVAGQYGTVVEEISEADIAILRLSTPYEPKGPGFGSFFHEGDLDFKGEEKARILNIMEQVPTVVDIYLERAAVIPEIANKAIGLTANFGAEDDVLLDVLFGKFNPQGKLPFELPSSMEAVRKQKEDVPYDSENPLFSYGAGLSY